MVFLNESSSLPHITTYYHINVQIVHIKDIANMRDEYSLHKNYLAGVESY